LKSGLMAAESDKQHVRFVMWHVVCVCVVVLGRVGECAPAAYCTFVCRMPNQWPRTLAR
jgi:hypothetical protein